MPSSRHGHSGSSDSTSSSGSSYQLILDHILTYPGSYEIPLRTMYTLNCAPRAQQPHSRSRTPSSPPTSPHATFADSHANQTFSENLMAQISQLPNQPASLPPSFLTSFLQRCFPAQLVEIDFPQALTGLDYLKDLETRRRREVRAAFARLDIDRGILGSEDDQLFSQYPGVATWVKSIEEKERKIDALYTQLYIGVRRWILINELSLIPFNKHNCVAMLNTLYPPVISTQPTSKLTREILKNQRDGYFKYIQSVERIGTQSLRNLTQQGKAPTDVNGWGAVTRTLGLYLQLANSMIDDCAEICDLQDVSPRKKSDTTTIRHPRKADSGVSFNSADIPSGRTEFVSKPPSPTEFSRPKTPAGGNHSSALEKIARGLKTIGRNRTDATEMISGGAPFPLPEKQRGLRKMQSMGNIENRKQSGRINVAGRANAFETDEARRLRMKSEAASLAQHKFGRNQSHEV